MLNGPGKMRVFFSVRSTAVWFDRIKFVRFERQYISLKLDAYSGLLWEGSDKTR
jgi:hypothetical protein